MADYKSLSTQYFDESGLRYTEPQENRVRLVYSGDNLKTIPVNVFFDPDGDPLVCIKCWEIATFKDDKLMDGIVACNDLNKRYRWVCFYIDDDGDVNAQCDAYVDEESCGSICKNLVERMVDIVDGAYPALMRTLWGNGD